MDSSNGKPSAYNNRMQNRYLPDSYQPTYGEAGSYQIPNSFNHQLLTSMNPYYWSTYPYHNLQYQGGLYSPMMMPENLNEGAFSSVSMPMRQMGQRIYNPQTNLRDNLFKNQKKAQPEIINLQSDQQEPENSIALLPIEEKKPQPKEIIQIQDNSPQNDDRIAQIMKKIQKEQAALKTKRQAAQRQKVLKQDQKIKSAHAQELRNKPIRKIKKNQFRDYLRLDKIQREKKSSETPKSKQIERILKIEKKKYQKHQKNALKQGSSTSPYTPSKKKIQKIQKPIEQPREISKYAQSHGQIRHGKQFQSYIPILNDKINIDFHIWIQNKRNKILEQQIGAITI